MTATETLLLQLKLAGLPKPEMEYRFDPKRQWKFDLCWSDRKVAVEIHGGIWVQKRHVTGQGFTTDREKMNEAQLQGWIVLECTEAQIENGKALHWVERALEITRL